MICWAGCGVSDAVAWLFFSFPLLPALPTMRFRGFPAMRFGFGRSAPTSPATEPTTTPPFPLGTVVTNTLFPVRGAVEVPKIPTLVPVRGAVAAFTVPVRGAVLFRCAVWHFDGGIWAGDVRIIGGAGGGGGGGGSPGWRFAGGCANGPSI